VILSQTLRFLKRFLDFLTNLTSMHRWKHLKKISKKILAKRIQGRDAVVDFILIFLVIAVNLGVVQISWFVGLKKKRQEAQVISGSWPNGLRKGEGHTLRQRIKHLRTHLFCLHWGRRRATLAGGRQGAVRRCGYHWGSPGPKTLKFYVTYQFWCQQKPP